MWIDGVSPLAVLDAYVAAARRARRVRAFRRRSSSMRYAPIMKDCRAAHRVDWVRLGIVAVDPRRRHRRERVANLHFPAAARPFPGHRRSRSGSRSSSRPDAAPDWSLLPGRFKGSIFLLALVTCASLMPVEKLPPASWQTAFGLGFVSAVFDNIPLTALALKQGGYDWGMLAYAVGFGGSMIWFGSSAGVAISNMYPEAKSVGQWLTHGWHVARRLCGRVRRHAGADGLAPDPEARAARQAPRQRGVLPGIAALCAAGSAPLLASCRSRIAAASLAPRIQHYTVRNARQNRPHRASRPTTLHEKVTTARDHPPPVPRRRRRHSRAGLPDDREGARADHACAGRAPGRRRTSSTSTRTTSPRR